MSTRTEEIQAAMQRHGGTTTALQGDKKHWEQKAVKHPGATTEAAKREGVSVREWAEQHKDSPGVTGERARLALRFEKQARKRRHKK